MFSVHLLFCVFLLFLVIGVGIHVLFILSAVEQ